MLEYKVRQIGNVAILDLNGRLRLGESLTFGSGSAAMLSDVIRDLFNKGHACILLNLRDLIVIDSSGLAELVAAYSSVRRQGGQLKVVNPSLAVRSVLSGTKLDMIFDMRDDEAEAIRSFDSRVAAAG